MNYTKIYLSLITKAKSHNRVKSRECVFEKHHIIPSCIGGGDENSNLVLLTPREHYIAHRLLVKMYPSSMGLNKAVWVFLNTGKDIVINSKSYEIYRSKVSQSMRENNPMFNSQNVSKFKISLGLAIDSGFKPFLATEEGKAMSSTRMKSDQHPMKNPISVAKKIQTDKDRGNESWMTTDKGKKYFSKKWQSDQHPLKLNPWNTHTSYSLEVELVDGTIMQYKMLKLFYEEHNINKDVAAKIIRTGIIPKKHQKKFKRITKICAEK
jgi:hypothetical protein